MENACGLPMREAASAINRGISAELTFSALAGNPEVHWQIRRNIFVDKHLRLKLMAFGSGVFSHFLAQLICEKTPHPFFWAGLAILVGCYSKAVRVSVIVRHEELGLTIISISNL